MPDPRVSRPVTSQVPWPAGRRAFHTLIAYGVIAFSWLAGAGWLLRLFVHDRNQAGSLHMVEGCVCLVITGVVMAWLQQRCSREVCSITQELSDREQRLRSWGDNLPNTYVYRYVPDSTGKPRFTYVSAGVERLHGVKPAEVLQDADCLLRLVMPESLPALAAAEAACTKASTDFEVEVWMKNPNGAMRLMHLHAHPHQREDGLTQWDGTATDVTDNRKAQSALQEHERQLRLFVEHSPAAIAMLDRDMRYLMTSHRWLRDYRLKETEVIGRSHYEIFPEIPARWKEIHRRCLAGAIEQCEADPFPRADGSLDWVRWEIRPWRTEQDTIGGLIIFSEVITERKTQEIEIQRLQRLYSTLSHINEAILRCQSRNDLFHEMCRVLVEFGKFTAAWVGEKKVTGKLETSSSRGLEPSTAGTLCLGTCGVTEQAMRGGCPVFCNTPRTDPQPACCREIMPKLGIQSCAAFPLRVRGQIAGAFSVCSAERGFFLAEENRLLEEVACNISNALDRLDEQEQRRQAEVALERAEKFTKAVLDSVTSHIAVLDRNGFIVAVNEPWNEFARANPLDGAMLPRNVQVGANYLEVCRKSQGSSSTGALEAYEGICAVMESRQQTFALEYPCDSPKEKRWFSMIVSRLGNDGEGVVISHTNITERKLAEAALRESEKKYRSIYESSMDAILTVDPVTKKFTSGNPAALRMFGAKSIAELVALGPADLSPERQANGRLSSEIAQEITATLRKGVTRFLEWKHRRLDGREFFVNVLLTRIEWDGGPAIMATVRDITARKEAREKLRESQQRFRTLVEAAPEAIFVRTGDRFTFVNEAALRLFGCTSVDQLVGKPVLERFQAECREEVSGRMARLDQASESTLKADRVLLKLDGSEVEVSLSAVPIKFRGMPSALVFARDISDRKRAEAALWQHFELQAQLAKIAATVPGAIYSYRLRPDGSMAMPYASAALERIFGVTPEQVREDASPILALIHPDDMRQVNESILSSARTLKPWREEFRARGTRCGDIWIEGHSVPQVETDGSVLWHGFLYDITERKQAEEQLRKLSRAVEQSPASIVITDAQGDIEYANPKFTELTGYKLEEIRGKNPRLLKTGKTSADEYRQLWQTIKRGETWRGEFLNRKKNGETFCEFASISPITDDAGKVTHFLAVKEDITERKHLEAQFRQSQKLEAIGQLAGGVAHDFNNILAAMMMQADLASLAQDVPETVRAGLKEIRAATDRAASLTRQLLLFSRKQVLQPRDLDLNEVVTGLVKMLQRIIREDVRLQLNLHPGPLLTHADTGMLDQVLMNLAVNARDAMPNGGQLFIETSEQTLDSEAARIHPDAAPGRYVSLTVTDTGSGMTPEVMSRIFEPFFTTKEPGKGTGLGLATVFGIIKQHRGWIRVQSEPGKGARFQVNLRASEGNVNVIDTITSPAPALSTGTETILLVEDESSLRRVTRLLLERQGYKVIEAANGVDAVHVWNQHRDEVALLLTDLVMPSGMTGQQLARELQSEKPTLKVVFTSGYSAEIAGGEIHLKGGENFVQKPCAPAVLLQTIRKTLQS